MQLLRRMLPFLGLLDDNSLTSVYVNNQAAIQIARETNSSKRRKFIHPCKLSARASTPQTYRVVACRIE